jgi:uncharacterized GH25 family protein
MLIKKTLLLPLSLLTALLAGPAQAHQIWIEQDGAGARLYLGEFGDNLRETSPGLLDKFSQPSARLITRGGEQEAKLAKQGNAFAIEARAVAGESIVAQESGYPGWERKQGDKVERHVWMPAARWVSDFAARQPVLALDLVPAGKAGEFQIFYQGQPLPEAKVQVVAASGWARELQADKEGRFTVSLPWKSAYALEAKHSDKRGGQRAGQAWDVGHFVTTLSFSLAQGLEAPPAPAPAAPAPAAAK